MKKKGSTRSSRMGAKIPKTVDDYMSRVAEPARTTLKKMRKIIRSVVPAETTEVGSYRIPTFHYKGSLVALAAFKDHCSLFPMGSSALEGMEKEFEKYRVAKGTLHFPVDKPMPSALVKKLVKARIAQNEARHKR